MGPIGRGFEPRPERPRALLVGGGVGIPPMVFLAESLRARRDVRFRPLVLMGSEIPFPFKARPSTLLVDGIPAGTIACMPLLDDWGVPSRLASLQGYPGCFEGYVTDLARHCLEALDEPRRSQVEIFAFGPHPMLAACARLARELGLPCQVSLEEYMACGLGGCAGCVVEYVRHGTQCFIVNFEVATGRVLEPTCSPTRTEVDFAAHIKRTVESDPAAGQWHFIVDNLNTHQSESLVR